VLLVHATIFGSDADAWYWRLTVHLDIGVTIFFLISGFLLYRPFVAARVLGAPGARLRDYARRRFLRIVPAYWLALTALAIIPGLYGVFSGNWWVYYGFLQDFPVYSLTSDCASDLYQCGIAPAWSLGIEVLFYAALPFFALGMGLLTARLAARAWVAVELAVLGVIAVWSLLIQNSTSATDLQRWLFFSPLGRGWWFGLGMGLAVLSVRAQQRGGEPALLRWLGEHPLVPWGAAAALYLTAVLFIVDPVPTLAGPVVPRTQYLFEYVAFGVVAGLLLLPAIFGAEKGGIPRRILANPVLAWLGLISYGIFLWHFPILYGLYQGGILDWWPSMAFPLLVTMTFAITVVCAALSYYLLERPLMRLKYSRRERERSRPGSISRQEPQRAG
jgi:peptidoglycan/LPS O-acetylase OafA/YrhL